MGQPAQETFSNVQPVAQAETFANVTPINSPETPPPVPRPPNPLQGVAGYDLLGPLREDQTLPGMVKGQLQNLYQISTPGIAASLLQKHFPSVYAKVAHLLPTPTPAAQLPNQIMENGTMMVATGALENGGFEPVGDTTPRATATPRPAAPQSSAPSAASRVADVAGDKLMTAAKRFVAGRIPGAHFLMDLHDIVSAVTEQPEAPTVPAARPPVAQPPLSVPEAPAAVRQGWSLARGPQTVVDPAAGLAQGPTYPLAETLQSGLDRVNALTQPVGGEVPMRPSIERVQNLSPVPAASAPGSSAAVPAAPEALPTSGAAAPAGNLELPRTLDGESALRQVLGGQGNANLLKIARSRGIDVAKEAQLKPGVADNLLINKIIDDFSPEELDDFRAKYAETSRFRHNFGDFEQAVGKDAAREAWKTLNLQQYFPDLKLTKASVARTRSTIDAAAKTAAPTEDLTDEWTKALQAVKAGKKLKDLQ